MLNKEPWLAVNISLLIPGLGHLYARRYIKGMIIIFFFLFSFGVGIYSFFSPFGNVIVGICLILAAVAITFYSLFDAHRCARLLNDKEFENIRKAEKDSWLAVFLSRILPGIGHFYKRKVGLGVCFVIIFIISIALEAISSWFIVLSSSVIAIACYHSYVLGRGYRESSKKPLILIVIAIFLFMIMGSLCPNLVESFRHPSSSMEPAIQRNEIFLVSKLNSNRFKRGDILVFKSPTDRRILLVKRLAGFAGETIEIKDGDIYINNNKLNDQFDNEIFYTSDGGFGVSGESYRISEEMVFVLGDNSENSLDSRYFGSVPITDIIGKAYKVIMPFSSARHMY